MGKFKILFRVGVETPNYIIHIYTYLKASNSDDSVSWSKLVVRVIFDVIHTHLSGLPFLRTVKSKLIMSGDPLSYEPPHEKTNNMHMRKQRRRSASR